MTRLFFDIETIPCDEEGKGIYFEVLRAKEEKKKKRKLDSGPNFANPLRPGFAEQEASLGRQAGMTDTNVSIEDAIKAAREELTLSEEDEDELIRKTALVRWYPWENLLYWGHMGRRFR